MSETFSLVLMNSGKWNAIAKLEHACPHKLPSTPMTTMMTLTEQAKPSAGLSYRVKGITLDKPGITEQITTFFRKYSINIQEMSASTIPALYTGVMTGAISMIISIPFDCSISKIREKFQELCKQIDLDGEIKPVDH